MRYLKIFYAISVLFLFDSIFSFDKVFSFDSVNEARETWKRGSRWEENPFFILILKMPPLKESCMHCLTICSPSPNDLANIWSLLQSYLPYWNNTSYPKVMEKFGLIENQTTISSIEYFFYHFIEHIFFHYHMRLWKISNEILEKSNYYFFIEQIFFIIA